MICLSIAKMILMTASSALTRWVAILLIKRAGAKEDARVSTHDKCIKFNV